MAIFVKIVLIVLAIAFYIFIYKALKGARRTTAASNFSVGGRKRIEKDAADMSPDERVRERKVSLRGGGMFNRRR